MDIATIMTLLVGKFPILALIFAVLGCLVILGQVVVPLTPSKADDEAWDKIMAIPFVGKILAALVAFAPIQKK